MIYSLSNFQICNTILFINYSPHIAHYISKTYFTYVSFYLFPPLMHSPHPCLFSMHLWGFGFFFFLSQCISNIIWYLLAFLCVIYLLDRVFTLSKCVVFTFGSKAVIPNSYSFILGSTFKCIRLLRQRWSVALQPCSLSITENSIFLCTFGCPEWNPYFSNTIGLLDWVLDHDKEPLSAEWLSPGIFWKTVSVLYISVFFFFIQFQEKFMLGNSRHNI